MSKHSGLLFIGFVVVAAIVVVVLINQPDTTEPTATNTNTVVPENANSNSNTNVTINNAVDGSFSLVKPAAKTEIGEIITYKFEDANSLSVMPAELKSAVLAETPIREEADLTVDGLAAKRYTLSSAKDGSLFTIVQVETGDKLYDFRGSDDYLNDLESYITFTNQTTN